MDHRYLDWPFFDPFHRSFARDFGEWAAAAIPPYEADAGGDGRAAREIFQRLGADKWLAGGL